MLTFHTPTVADLEWAAPILASCPTRGCEYHFTTIYLWGEHLHKAIAPAGGWTFNLLIVQLSVVHLYNGLMLLPVLSASSQLLMTKVSGAQQTAGNDQAASTGKFMNWFFPIFSLVLCFSYSSAFALYWVSGNLIMLVQTLIINKVLDSKEEQKAMMAGEGSVK